MVDLNTPQKLSGKVFGYLIIKSLIITIIVLLFLYFFGLPAVPAPYQQLAKIALPAILILSLLFTFLYWKIYTYTVFIDHMLIRSGVLFQNEKAVNFNDIQSINAALGPLLAIFGLRQIKGFTSSPEQLVIRSSQNSGTSTTHIPDLSLVIEKDTAQQILDLVQKGDVQKVQNITS